MTTEQQKELAALRAENARLREALRPFAQMAEGLDEWPIDNGCGTFPSVRMIRKARAALAHTGAQ